MPKINRGETTKLSIKLSSPAREFIEVASKNLNLSKGGTILFVLAKLLQDPPSKQEILNLENKIDLEKNHFVLTVNEQMSNRLNALAEEYDMKKNVLYGLMVSNHFEKEAAVNNPVLKNLGDSDPKTMMIQVNEDLKKKMIEYSEKYYISLNGLISYAVLGGPYDGLPRYDMNGSNEFFTSVPKFIGDIVKEQAALMNIREHFYVSLCLYKAFMDESGRFYNK